MRRQEGLSTAVRVARRLLAVAAASAVGLALPTSAQGEQMPAHSAAHFRDSIGVNTHATYYDTAYGDWPRVVDKLDELGITHLRDGAFANPEWGEWNERFYRAVELAGARGLRFTLGMGEPNFAGGTLDQLIGAVGGRLRNAVAALEGPNEYDLYHAGPNWDDELREYQRELYAKAKANAVLRSLPVLAPSLVFPESDPQLGRLDDALDVGNVHPYTGGDQPSPGHVKHQADEARRVSGSKPMFATEAGYHNALAATHGQPPVSESVGASYLLRLYLEHFRGGIVRTYAYEAIDEKLDLGLVEPESHFGLLRNDFSEKPAFTALQRMLQLIGRPEPLAPSSLTIGLGGDTTHVQSLLLRKSERRYTLALWQFQSEWDLKLRRPQFPPEREVRISLPFEATVNVARPARSGETTFRGQQRDFTIGAPADPLLIDLEFPAGAKLPAAEAPDPASAVPTIACPPLAKGGGLVREKRRARSRMKSLGSRSRAVRFEFCSTAGGRAVMELRGARGRLLARHKLRVSGGKPVKREVRWTRRSARGLAKGGTVLARVRYRQSGSKKEVVLAGRVRVSR